MEPYLIILIRIITIMSLLLFATLFIMGKRPIGELPVFDFLVLIVFGSIVGADIADPDIEHLPTAFAVVVLACFQRLISHFHMKSKRFRKLITFEPTVVVYNGNLIYKNIKRIHYSVDEVIMMFREKNTFDIGKVEYGIIEASGKLSVLLKPQFEKPSINDLQLAYPASNASVTVVLDGQLQKSNIAKLSRTEPDILLILKQHGLDTKDVFFASLDHNGNVLISSYNEDVKDYFAEQS
jgi:uncharacterized membrane protein YcaP (DUF421 family)